eukprot:244783-Hanusia_phi.AAC.3
MGAVRADSTNAPQLQIEVSEASQAEDAGGAGVNRCFNPCPSCLKSKRLPLSSGSSLTSGSSSRLGRRGRTGEECCFKRSLQCCPTPGPTLPCKDAVENLGEYSMKLHVPGQPSVAPRLVVVLTVKNERTRYGTVTGLEQVDTLRTTLPQDSRTTWL